MVLGLATILQRVGILIHGLLVRAVGAVVMETANFVIRIGVRVNGRLEDVQFRLIVSGLQQIVQHVSAVTKKSRATFCHWYNDFRRQLKTFLFGQTAAQGIVTLVLCEL